MVTLYSTGCPKCRILKSKLDAKNIEYDEICSVPIIMELGIKTVPVLKVENELLDFFYANKWINEQ